MADMDVAYLNQDAVSWAHIKWIVSLPDFGNVGGRYYGFHSLDWGGEKRDRQPVYGQNRSQGPMAFSSGKYGPPNPKIGWLAHALDANSKAPFTSYLELLGSVAPAGPSGLKSYGNIRMNWILQVIDDVINMRYEWRDVYVVGRGGTWEETADGLKAETEHVCKRFIVNGYTMYDSSQE